MHGSHFSQCFFSQRLATTKAIVLVRVHVHRNWRAGVEVRERNELVHEER
jgi:hypothetical protein